MKLIGLLLVTLIVMHHIPDTKCQEEEHHDSDKGSEQSIAETVSRFSETLFRQVGKWIQQLVKGGNDNDRMQLDDGYIVVGSIEHVKWSPNKPFAANLIARGEPMILKGSSVDFWKARQSWTPALLLERERNKRKGNKGVVVDDEELVNIRKMGKKNKGHQHDVFSFQNGNGFGHQFILASPKTYLPGEKPSSWKNQHELVNMSLVDFLESFEKQNGELLYFSGPVGALGEDYIADIKPLLHFDHVETMFAKEQEKRAKKEKSGRVESMMGANAWISHGNVVAQTHYDISDNFFVQLSGNKTWILFPPEEVEKLYLYPFTHPRKKQSKLVYSMDEDGKVLLDPSLAHLEDQQGGNLVEFNYPLMNRVKAFKVTVQPGDVMYVPPLWAHRVVSDTPSISVSVLNPSDSEYLFSKALHTPLYGLSNKWSEMDKGLAIRKFVQLLVAAADWIKQPVAEFMDFFYHSRFEHLIQEYRNMSTLPKNKGSVPFQCWGVPRDQEPQFRQETLDAFNKIVAEVLSHFDHKKMPLRNKRIFLMDYIEHVSAWAVMPWNLGEFFETCF